jgi:hypothetical protein
MVVPRMLLLVNKKRLRYYCYDCVSERYTSPCFYLKQRFGDWILSASSGGTSQLGPIDRASHIRTPSSSHRVILRPTLSPPVWPGIRPLSGILDTFFFLLFGNYLQEFALSVATRWVC